MTTDTQKIDVLAVMGSLHHYLLLASDLEAQKRMHPLANSMEARAFNLIEDAKEARAAVAELIEAADDLRCTHLAHNRSAYCSCWDSDDRHDSDRLAAILARVGGAA